jgi:hypothetical protein
MSSCIVFKDEKMESIAISLIEGASREIKEDYPVLGDLFTLIAVGYKSKNYSWIAGLLTEMYWNIKTLGVSSLEFCRKEQNFRSIYPSIIKSLNELILLCDESPSIPPSLRELFAELSWTLWVGNKPVLAPFSDSVEPIVTKWKDSRTGRRLLSQYKQEE